jgi:hypothetical protein
MIPLEQMPGPSPSAADDFGMGMSKFPEAIEKK